MQINTSSLFVNLNGRPPALQNGFLKLSNKKIHSFYGGNEEITKDSALLYKYRMANPVKIFEKGQNHKPIDNVSDVPGDFLAQLNEEGYSWDEFRFQSAFDIEWGDDLDYILSRLAASYVTVYDQLNSHFSGAELEDHMARLDAAVSKVMSQRADVFAENVGGFLEENGFAGEKDKIYDTIASEYQNKVRQYREFLRNNSDYAKLKGTEYEWLADDAAYMAQGYEVSAIQYLLKPLSKEKLFAVLERLKRKKPPEEKLTFQTGEGLLLVTPAKIWFAEAQGHQSILYTDHESYKLRHSITELARLLEGQKEFVRSHRSYLVNLRHISAITRTELVMDDFRRLPVSRSAYRAVNTAFIANYGIGLQG